MPAEMFVNLKANVHHQANRTAQFPTRLDSSEKAIQKFCSSFSNAPFDLGNMSLPNPQNESAFLDHSQDNQFRFHP